MMNVDKMSMTDLMNVIKSAKDEITKREEGEQYPVYVVQSSGTNFVFKNIKDAMDEFLTECPDVVFDNEPLRMYIKYVNISDYEKEPDVWIEL